MISILIFVLFIIVLYVSWYKYYLYKYNFYCKNYFNFNKSFTKLEKEYLNICFKLIPLNLLYYVCYGLIDKNILRYSFITFSNRIKFQKVNSSCFAIGSILFTKLLNKYYKAILNERKILSEVNECDNIRFGGLGWDFENNILKIYYKFKNKKDLPNKYEYLYKNYKSKKYLDE